MLTLAEKSSPWIDTAPGVRRRTVAVGERLFQMFVEFQPDASTPSHSHPHEQVIHVIRGSLRLTLSGGTIDLATGESFCLHANVPHGAQSETGALLLDTFSPPREDLIEQDRNV